VWEGASASILGPPPPPCPTPPLFSINLNVGDRLSPAELLCIGDVLAMTLEKSGELCMGVHSIKHYA
jgi:hypothetical protein